MDYIKIGNPSVLSKLQDGGVTDDGEPILLYNGHIVGFAPSDSQSETAPTISVSQTANGYILTIVDQEHPDGVDVEILNGTNGTNGTDGADGNDGSDGVSPIINVETITGGHRVTIIDASHPSGQTFDIMDGANAQDEHSHDNKASLDKISEKSGCLSYNGKVVGIQVTNTIPQNNADLEAGRIIYFTGQGQNPFGFAKNGLMYWDKFNGGWVQMTTDGMVVSAHDHSNMETLNRVSEKNGILAYRNKSIHEYIRDLHKAFTSDGAMVYFNSESSFVQVESNQLSVDESTVANINEQYYLEVIV